MIPDARAQLRALLDAQGQDLRSLAGRLSCRGTTRDGEPCRAHSVLIGTTGFCPWHDPDLAADRALWRKRGLGFWGRVIAQAEQIRGMDCLSPNRMTSRGVWRGTSPTAWRRNWPRRVRHHPRPGGGGLP